MRLIIREYGDLARVREMSLELRDFLRKAELEPLQQRVKQLEDQAKEHRDLRKHVESSDIKLGAISQVLQELLRPWIRTWVGPLEAIEEGMKVRDSLSRQDTKMEKKVKRAKTAKRKLAAKVKEHKMKQEALVQQNRRITTSLEGLRVENLALANRNSTLQKERDEQQDDLEALERRLEELTFEVEDEKRRQRLTLRDLQQSHANSHKHQALQG
jgi:chromosome segregation ATPase